MRNNDIDLAGSRYLKPQYLQNRARINELVDNYLAINVLSDRLSDLNEQFVRPQPRPWQPINWRAINQEQIIGVEPEIFLQLIAGAAEIEDPIRGYAQESRCYLEQVHPPMAKFMGGMLTKEAKILELGVWEKEERQHAPTFQKIYQQLSGKKLQPKPNTVKGYQPTSEPWQDVYRHTLSRISTEWSATSVYLWLMAHSTGELQSAISQPLQDEINHLAKFWGFSSWAFAESYFNQLKGSTKNLITLLKHNQSERTQGKDLINKAFSLNNLVLILELTFTFTRVMVRLRRWDKELSRSYLRHLFGNSPVIYP